MDSGLGATPRAGFASLPPDLLRRLHAHVKRGSPRDEASLASVNRDTFNALDEHRQGQLMAQGRLARTPQALLKVLQDSLTLEARLRPGPLEAAGHRLGQMAASLQDPGQVAPVFHALWDAVAALPDGQRPRPLFAAARQIAVLPPRERLAAMEAALDHIDRIPRDGRRFGGYETTRYQTVRDYAYLLPDLPAQDRSPARQRLSAAGKAFSKAQQDEFFRLLEKTDSLAQTASWRLPSAGETARCAPSGDA